MKKIFSLLLVCLACLSVSANKTYTFQLTDNWDVLEASAKWGTSYLQRTIAIDGATLVFTKACHQTANVTDCPVTKGSPVTVTLENSNANILSAEIQCKKWSSKAQTVTLNSSTDGQTFTATSVKSYDFEPMTGTFESTDGVKAVRWTFSSTSNQVGIKYITIVTDETDAKVKTPTFSLKSGTYCGPQKVTLNCATEGASMIYYFGDDETEYNEYSEFGQEIEINESCTLHAIAYYQGETSQVASATYVIVPFLATDGSNRIISDKYPKSPLTVKYGNYVDGLTVKVNGKEVAYDPAKGVSIPKTSLKNENDTISIYNGEELVAQRVYTWVPSVNISNFKTLEDGTEAVINFNNGNKVTYVSSDGKTAFFEDASKGVEGYNLGLKLEAYKTISAGAIWGKKTTYNGIVEITMTDSTSTYSSVTQNATAVNPTALTVAQTLLENNQLRYAKINGAQIIVQNKKYYAVCVNDTVQLYDSFKTNVLSTLQNTPCYADVTGIIACYKDVIEVYPLSIENVCDTIKGVSGTVSWAIDMDGMMTFYPTDGVSGTLAKTGIAASTRSWSAYSTLVKNVKFDEGVNSAAGISYMFYQMSNLQEVEFSNFNTSAATTIASLFANCSSLVTADLSDLDLSNVTTMASAFNACSSLEDVNFGNYDAAKLTDMKSAFYNCISLQNLYLDNFAPTGLTNISTAFFGCESLQTLDIRQLSTEKITKANNISNVFGTLCIPSTLVLSNKFGKAGTSYVTLPSATYADPEGKQYTLPEDQEALYAYSMANEAGYTEFNKVLSPTTEIKSIDTVVKAGNSVRYNLAGQRVNANAKGIVIMNGKKMLVK